jgi:hypothetical protein
VTFGKADAQAAAKVRHFETYNRTPASQQVADIVTAAGTAPGAVLVASGDTALAGLLAAAVAPIGLAILDVGTFDTSRDADFVERLYIPALRRAGDLQTAAVVAAGDLVIHNAGPAFRVEAAGRPDGRRPRVQPTKLSAREIVTLVRTATRRPPRS